MTDLNCHTRKSDGESSTADDNRRSRTLLIATGWAIIVAGSVAVEAPDGPFDGRALSPADVDHVLALQADRAYEAPRYTGSTTFGVPITFHIVRRSDGTLGLTEADLQEALDAANDAFAPVNIEFCRSGPTIFIDDDAFFEEIDTQAEIDALRQTDPVPDTVNVYSVAVLADEFGPLTGVSSYTFSEVQGIVIDQDYTPPHGDPSTLMHLLGRYFDLFDTDETAFGVECVTGINCDVAGDLICDTPADPGLEGVVGSDCIYDEQELGPCPGDPLYHPDPTNFMSNASYWCRDSFTPQQCERALATLLNLRPKLVDNCPEAEEVIYVDADAPPGGDGMSWETAFSDLHDALSLADELGDEYLQVWVAAGTYKPDRGTGDRDQAFQLRRSGLAIYGGFAGGESNLEERDLLANPTILSGDLLDNDAPEAGFLHPTIFDNSYHVLIAWQTNSSAILDGFEIRGGSAIGAPSPRSRGGGVLLNQAVMTIENCRFIHNRAVSGGALFSAYGLLLAADCVFEMNYTYGNGASVRSDGSFVRCDFSDNHGSYWSSSGAAVYGSGEFIECTFLQNSCGHYGGAVYAQEAVIINCHFEGNVCEYQAGAVRTEDDTTVQGCTFVGNECLGNVGALECDGGTTTIDDCVFFGNSAVHGSGAISIGGTRCTIDSCTFEGNATTGEDRSYGAGSISAGAILRNCNFSNNTATRDGGALGLGGDSVLIDCRFVGNHADVDAGAVFDHDDSGTMIDCAFLGNSAGGQGGAVGLDDGSKTLVNCTFSGNHAGTDGGAVCTGSSEEIELINCSLSGNSADGTAGGVHLHASITARIRNCILWNNSDAAHGTQEPAQIFVAEGCDAIVDYSCIQNLTGDLGGEGNIGDDPLFVDPDGPDDVVGTVDDDLRLDPVSPGIDAADNTVVPPDAYDLDDDGNTTEPLPIDIAGMTRFVDAPAIPDTGKGDPPLIDIGAHEFDPGGAPCPADCAAPRDGVVNESDLFALLAEWNSAGSAADLNEDGNVDVQDLLILLEHWGRCP